MFVENEMSESKATLCSYVQYLTATIKTKIIARMRQEQKATHYLIQIVV